MIRRPPRTTLSYTRFRYPTLFRSRRAPQDLRPRMSHLRRAPARPRQAVGLAVAGTAVRAQGGPVEGVLVGHVEPQALRRLAGVADRPGHAIELAGDVLDQRLEIGRANV